MTGKPFKTILPDPQVGHLGIHVPQIHLLSVLLEAAEEYPSFIVDDEHKGCRIIKG